MTARIETEVAFLGVEFQSGGLAHLIDIVRKRGQGASALDYLVQDQAGAHLAGEVPATPGLTPGWTRIEVPQASEDGGRPERVRAFVSDLGDGVLLAVGGDLQQVDNLEKVSLDHRACGDARHRWRRIAEPSLSEARRRDFADRRSDHRRRSDAPRAD